MKLLIISASMRKESQSIKIAQWLHRSLQRNQVDSGVLDLHELQLPMYDNGETTSDAVSVLQATLREADGFVFVSPEWNGMMSHGLVNMLHYVGHELAHKPVMLTAVSAGRNGHYPLLQMRTMGYKNTHFVVSPESLLVQDCELVCNDDDMSDHSADIYVKRRAEYALRALAAYAEALRAVRTSGVIDLTTFNNGV